jgi:hypothetical protein
MRAGSKRPRPAANTFMSTRFDYITQLVAKHMTCQKLFTLVALDDFVADGDADV